MIKDLIVIDGNVVYRNRNIRVALLVLINHLNSDEDISKNKVLAITQKIQTVISIPIEFNSIEINASSSIGICLFKENDKRNDELIKRADSAMYDAKKITIK